MSVKSLTILFVLRENVRSAKVSNGATNNKNNAAKTYFIVVLSFTVRASCAPMDAPKGYAIFSNAVVGKRASMAEHVCRFRPLSSSL